LVCALSFTLPDGTQFQLQFESIYEKKHGNV
jgi:hypothetical protein